MRARLCASGGQVDIDLSILKISIHRSVAGSADKTLRLWRTGRRRLIVLKISIHRSVAGSADKTVRL